MPSNNENQIKVIDAESFRDMVSASLYWLKEQKSFIDSLNVFPVPDGDTGTNMYLTFREAFSAVENCSSRSVDDLAAALSKGALMGARGNSGVILSQLIRGFSQSVDGKKKLRSGDLASALKKASEVAYHGVLKPVEGTILTVSREAADKAVDAAKKNRDIIKVLEITREEAEASLERTPELLDTLKEAEVVDAGGQGYLIIIEGMLKALKNEEFEYEAETKEKTIHKKTETAEEIKFTYCTQMLIEVDTRNRSLDSLIAKIRKDMQSYGDSIMVVGDDGVIKIHVHTNHPGVLLEYGLKKGKVFDIKIDNMRKQNIEKVKKENSADFDISKFHSGSNNEKKAEDTAAEEDKAKTEDSDKKSESEKIKVEKNTGIISVGNGEGIINILKELGVDYIIEGGQSMNPSTSDFAEAVENLDIENIIILPNNKNIISAAKQVSELSDKNIAIVETKSIPQAISALMVYNDELDPAELKEEMESEITEVKTLEITKAVKDSKVNGMEIKEGAYIGLCNNNIAVSEQSKYNTIVKLLESSFDDEELLTIYYGEGVNLKEAEDIKEMIKNKFDIDEVEVYNGGQPLYPYIISLE